MNNFIKIFQYLMTNRNFNVQQYFSYFFKYLQGDFFKETNIFQTNINGKGFHG